MSIRSWYKGCYHHHHVQEGLDLIPVPFIIKMKLVLPSLPRSSYVSSSFWFILQCLFRYPVCVRPLYVLQPLFLVPFYFLYYILCSCFFPNTLFFFCIKDVIFYLDSYTNFFLLALCELLENSESKKFNTVLGQEGCFPHERTPTAFVIYLFI